MIPLGVLALMAILFGLSQALEMIVNTRRNAAVTAVMYGEPKSSSSWYAAGKEEK